MRSPRTFLILPVALSVATAGVLVGSFSHAHTRAVRPASIHDSLAAAHSSITTAAAPSEDTPPVLAWQSNTPAALSKANALLPALPAGFVEISADSLQDGARQVIQARYQNAAGLQITATWQPLPSTPDVPGAASQTLPDGSSLSSSASAGLMQALVRHQDGQSLGISILNNAFNAQFPITLAQLQQLAASH